MVSVSTNAAKIESESNILLNEAASMYFNNPSQENKEALVLASEKLISYFARLYGCGYHLDDLKQAGLLGLVKAINRFNYENGASFTTYAVSCIIGEIKHFVRGEQSYYKPRCVKALQDKLENIIIETLDEEGDIPSPEKLAKEVNIKPEGIKVVLRAGLVPLDNLNLDTVVTLEPESFKLVLEDRILLETALKKLSEIQKKVIYMLFYRDMTQEQTAKELGVQQRQVSRLKERSLKEMRKDMDE